MELPARIEALLRRAPRAPAPAPDVFHFANAEADFRAASVTRDGQLVALPAREFHLLRYLIEHRGETIPRERLRRAKHPERFLALRGLGHRFAG
jgi:DNA-binding response OmpR family regulator